MNVACLLYTSEKTNATVYNCAFPDSSVACKYAEYNPSYTRDHFNLYYVVTFLEQNPVSYTHLFLTGDLKRICCFRSVNR